MVSVTVETWNIDDIDTTFASNVRHRTEWGTSELAEDLVGCAYEWISNQRGCLLDRSFSSTLSTGCDDQI